MIELIGVLTILALLAAAVIPNVIRRMDRAAWEKEKADLQAMADSYTRYILRTKSITNSAGMGTVIAQEMALSLSAINTTPRGWDRAFLVDPNFNIDGGNSYMQSSSGTSRPLGARMLMLSSISGGLPVGSSDNNSDFQAIWETSEGAKPSASTWNSWQGKGEDLLIRKLNLEPLFYELILADLDKAGIKYSIDSTNSILSSVGSLNSYYLDGTVLGLYDCATNLQTRYLLQRNISFVFESCAWRGQIQGAGVRPSTNSTSLSASNFVSSASTFYASSWNQAAQSGASQTSVLVAMYTFMFDYVFWATECPHFDYHGYTGSSLSTLPEYKMINDMGQSCNGCSSIDSFSGAGGLLK